MNAAALAACLLGIALRLAWRPGAGLPRSRRASRAGQVEHPHDGPISPGRRALLGVVGGLAAVCLFPGPTGWVAAPVAGLVVAVGLGRLEPGRARRERAAVLLAMPETLDLIASGLDAGLPVRGATAHVARLGPDATRPALTGVVARVGVGMSDADAWRAAAQEPGWNQVALDLARSCETGAAAAQVLRQHAADARSARRDALMARARAVGVRSTVPLMACFLPAFVLVGVVPVVAGLVSTYLNP